MSRQPPDLASLLGAAHPQWDALLRFVDQQRGVAQEWKFYGAKYGWQLKLVTRKRALAYLIPRDGHFTVAVALRPKAIEALRAASDVPQALVREVEQAREAPEGRPARVEVREASHRELAERLLAIKLATA